MLAGSGFFDRDRRSTSSSFLSVRAGRIDQLVDGSSAFGQPGAAHAHTGSAFLPSPFRRACVHDYGFFVYVIGNLNISTVSISHVTHLKIIIMIITSIHTFHRLF